MKSKTKTRLKGKKVLKQNVSSKEAIKHLKYQGTIQIPSDRKKLVCDACGKNIRRNVRSLKTAEGKRYHLTCGYPILLNSDIDYGFVRDGSDYHGSSNKPVKQSEYDKNFQTAIDKSDKRYEFIKKHKKDNPALYKEYSEHPATINRHRKIKKAKQIQLYYQSMKSQNKKAFIVDTLTPAYTFKPYTHELVFISPQRFLDLTPEPPRFSDSSLDYLRGRMKDGKEIEPPYLEVDIDFKRVETHEGRHRSKVAKELGIEKIPVIIVHKKDGREIPASNLPMKMDELYPQLKK